jgi:GH18 family chitinase
MEPVGTAAPGANGCISNCGVNIINVSPPVNQFMRIGYYEGWTGSRSCLKMDVSDINFFGANDYTHVHFAFGSDVAAQFNKFVAVPQGSFKKVLSFGGWSFSTDVDSFPIFRTGVTSANRQTFANNVVAFIVANGLDGVDFD